MGCRIDKIACLLKIINTMNATNIPSHAALLLFSIKPLIDRMQHININNLLLLGFNIKTDITDAGTVKHKYCPYQV